MKNYKLEKSEEWILAENLNKQELSESSFSIDDSNPKSDFGSYKILKSNPKESLIEYHNCMNEAASCYAESVTQLIGWHTKNDNLSIIDVGCGAGFVTNELKLLNPNASITGLDISSDGIDFANRNFSNIHFEKKAIDVGTVFSKKVKIIHAREFYPFSRTNNLDLQIDYLRTFLENIDNDGFIIIGNIHNEKSIFNNYVNIKKNLEQFNNSKVDRVVLPMTKIFKLVPSLTAAGFLTKMINIFLRRNNSYLMTILKTNNK